MFIFRFSLFPVLAILCSGLSSCNNNKWEPLFNGENLEGWTVNCIPADQEKVYWTVKEDFIECNSLGDPDHNYVWLTSNREYSDFHLKLKFQVFWESGGNSGVQFRSRYDD